MEKVRRQMKGFHLVELLVVNMLDFAMAAILGAAFFTYFFEFAFEVSQRTLNAITFACLVAIVILAIARHVFVCVFRKRVITRKRRMLKYGLESVPSIAELLIEGVLALALFGVLVLLCVCASLLLSTASLSTAVVVSICGLMLTGVAFLFFLYLKIREKIDSRCTAAQMRCYMRS